ncbi:MAG: IPT/TIG domain-containing protein, partial [Nitrospirota bacterium]
MFKRLVEQGAVRMLMTVFAWMGCLLVGLASPAWAENGLSPQAAPPGATVVISGKGFGSFKSTQDNRVLFKGVPALVQQWDSELIAVKVPFRAASGPVTVISGKKTITAGTFTVQQPTIRSVLPAEVEPGGVLQVIGEHFGTTAGSRDSNTMFGVNDVVIGGATAKVRRWRDDKIEVEVPGTALSGHVVVRLASSDPLPDGSCCAQVEYSISNPAPLTVIPAIRADPLSGPIGTKVVLFGQEFGVKAPGDQLLFNGHPGVIAQWTDVLVVAHVPLDAVSGPLVLKRGDTRRIVGTFSVPTPKATGLSVSSGPIGTLLRITGENFGFYSESGSTPFSFTDFNRGENVVEIGGVPAVVYRWHDDKIDVWVPFSAKSGPVVVKRGGTKPKADGSCCAERGLITTEAGRFTVSAPTVASYAPTSAGLDEIVTIKGSGFGAFLKTAEQTQPGLNEAGHDSVPYEFGENVARTEVLFNNMAAVIVSWTDTEIQVRVPRRHLFGVGKKNEFNTDLATGPLVVRRGAWDVKADGSCCTAKQWVTAEAGTFTILARGLPAQSMFTDTRPEA